MFAKPQPATKGGSLRSKTTAAIAIVILIPVAIAASFKVYLNFEDSGTTVLWNDKEAYFFIGTRSIGHRVNLLWFPWFLAKNYLGAVEDPDDIRGSSDAIRVTSSNVEHHMLKVVDLPPGAGPAMYTPLEGHIYVNYPALGGLCRWAGDHFESATPEERHRLDGITHLTNKDIEHDVNGWSKHSFAVGPGDINDTFPIEVGNSFKLSLSDLAAQNGDRAFSINLLRPGYTPERIWNRQLRWGRVSKAEYRRVFQDRE